MKLANPVLKYTVILLVIIPVLSCCRKHVSQKEQSEPVAPSLISLLSPEPNKIIHCGDSLKVEFSVTDTTVKIDSVSVYEGPLHTRSILGNNSSFYWNSSKSRVGQNTLRFVFYYNDSLQESHNLNIVILSDIEPVNYTFRIIRKFPHDNQAYTQGLIFDNGILYESTGLEGKSSLRIVDIGSGKPEKMINLPGQYFAEGIALLNDRIYQITWRSQVGFVYDKKSLAQIRSFDYQIQEGWGLTTDNKNLIMTDGSAQVYFIEPEYFTQVDKIQVFDNKGMMDSLNELEYIHGKLLANVYGKTFIVIIDPLTGKVTGKAEFKSIMPEGSINDYSKVLNGIAYDPQTGHLYITGKNWPVLYEVEMTPAL